MSDSYRVSRDTRWVLVDALTTLSLLVILILRPSGWWGRP
jgi:hypothetical protein